MCFPHLIGLAWLNSKGTLIDLSHELPWSLFCSHQLCFSSYSSSSTHVLLIMLSERSLLAPYCSACDILPHLILLMSLLCCQDELGWTKIVWRIAYDFLLLTLCCSLGTLTRVDSMCTFLSWPTFLMGSIPIRVLRTTPIARVSPDNATLSLHLGCSTLICISK